MKTCNTCRHWDTETERSWATDGWGRCALAAYDGEPEHPESLAVTGDVEGYIAWLRTAPTFGCVQHYEKGLTKEEVALVKSQGKYPDHSLNCCIHVGYGVCDCGL